MTPDALCVHSDYQSNCLGCNQRVLDVSVASLGASEQLVEELQEELELAIAHDRQPYPTAEAYEKACALYEASKQRVKELEAQINGHATND